jgi:hypothetical protein
MRNAVHALCAHFVRGSELTQFTRSVARASVRLCPIAAALLITLGRAACFVAWMCLTAQVHTVFPEVVVVII